MGKMIPEDECPEGLPAWLATFGDLMSLLLTFFVLLLSFSEVNVKDFRQTMGALAGALGVLSGEPEMSLPIRESFPRSEGNLQQAEVIAKAAQELEEAVEEAGLQGDIMLDETSAGIVIRIADKLFFDLGKAELKSGGLPILDKLGEVLRGLPNDVNIQGHTDNLSINTEYFASNWELSGMRALEVGRYFIQRSGISPARISITGYSEYHPLVPNDTEEHRKQNRRVEIHVRYRGERGVTPREIYRSVEDKGLEIKGREGRTEEP